MPPPNVLKIAIVITGTLKERDAANPNIIKRVTYQRVGAGLGHRRLSKTRDLQRRRHVIPYDPRTPLQVALRQRFAQAVAAWHAMPAATREQYRARAAKNRITLFNQHMSEYTAQNPIDTAPLLRPLAPLSLGNTSHPQQKTTNAKTTHTHPATIKPKQIKK